MTRIMGVVLASILSVAVTASPASSTCHCFPCLDCQIQSNGQLNLVVMDRAAGKVRLVPNLNFQGLSADFGLVVPTPALPSLEPIASDIWNAGFDLTAPVAVTRRQDSSPFSCSEDMQLFAMDSGDPSIDTSTGQEVTIHSRQTVGGFDVTILSSQDPNALVTWLQDNQFDIAAEDAAKFGPFVERGWFFTAMKPDLTDPANRMPAGGWNNSVNPVLFEFESDGFEFPSTLMAINRAPTFDVVMYVVDDHRMTLEGFMTTYANKLSADEYRAISERYPSWTRFLSPGRYLTRLDRTYQPTTAMDRSLFLERAHSNAEFRRTFTSRFFKASVSLEALVLVLLVLVPTAWLRRRLKREA